MKERPILFSGEMVRAILDWRKTMTRRVVKPQPAFERRGGEENHEWYWGKHWIGGCFNTGSMQTALAGRCPYGQPGERLWVRETWAHEGEKSKPVGYRADGAWGSFGDYSGDGYVRFQRAGWINGVAKHRENGHWVGMGYVGSKWRPSIHMPRWASRITLEIVSVRVERLQEISECDAALEGVDPLPSPVASPESEFAGSWYRPGFKLLWQSINGSDSWDANPWVWAIEFKRMEA